eukprot:919772-Rhodomonas_salina.2
MRGGCDDDSGGVGVRSKGVGLDQNSERSLSPEVGTVPHPARSSALADATATGSDKGSLRSCSHPPILSAAALSLCGAGCACCGRRGAAAAPGAGGREAEQGCQSWCQNQHGRRDSDSASASTRIQRRDDGCGWEKVRRRAKRGGHGAKQRCIGRGE